MKRVLLILFLLSFVSIAKAEVYGLIGPAVGVGTTTTVSMTIAIPGAGKTNCLTDIMVFSTNTYTFRILNGNTTFYQLSSAPAATQHSKVFNSDLPLCGSVNTALILKLAPDTGGSGDVYYSGFIRR